MFTGIDVSSKIHFRSDRAQLIASDDALIGYIYMVDGSLKVVNITGIEILRLLINNQYTVKEIAEILAKKYSVQVDSILPDILEFIDKLVKIGVLDVEEHKAGECKA